jgi:putative membrane protein
MHGHGLFWVPFWGYYCYSPWGWFFWGRILAGVVVFLCIFCLLFLLFWAGRHMFRPSRFFEEDPIEILKRRYARGEITKEEYERMREELKR